MKKLIFVLALPMLAACAVNVKMPVNRMMSPETQGEFLKGELSGRWVGVTDIEIANNKTSATPNITPDMGEDGAVGYGLSVGLFKYLDFYYHTADDSPSSFGLKFQVLGEPRSTAKKGNHSLALAAAVAHLSEDETETETLGSDTGKAKIKAAGHEAMLLYGYRATEKALIYLGPYIYNIEPEASVFRTSSGVTTNTANVKGEAEQTGFLLGVRAGPEKSFISLEGGYAKTTYKRTEPSVLKIDDYDEFFLGLAGGLLW